MTTSGGPEPPPQGWQRRAEHGQARSCESPAQKPARWAEAQLQALDSAIDCKARSGSNVLLKSRALEQNVRQKWSRGYPRQGALLLEVCPRARAGWLWRTQKRLIFARVAWTNSRIHAPWDGALAASSPHSRLAACWQICWGPSRRVDRSGVHVRPQASPSSSRHWLPCQLHWVRQCMFTSGPCADASENKDAFEKQGSGEQVENAMRIVFRFLVAAGLAHKPRRAFAIEVKNPPEEHVDSVMNEFKERLALSDAAVGKVITALDLKSVSEQFALESFKRNTALHGTSLKLRRWAFCLHSTFDLERFIDWHGCSNRQQWQSQFQKTIYTKGLPLVCFEEVRGIHRKGMSGSPAFQAF